MVYDITDEDSFYKVVNVVRSLSVCLFVFLTGPVVQYSIHC